MGDQQAYEPGTPSWVDLGSSNTTRAGEFYSSLFGWEVMASGPIEETGGYAMFKLDGKDVAGLGPGEQPSWTMYVAVADADVTTKQVEASGGTVVMAPMAIMAAGRMALFLDPGGATFAVWEPGEHRGAEVVNEPGSFCWNELAYRDVEEAKAFYEAVFGWAAKTEPFAETSSYTQFFLPGAERSIAGMVQMNEVWPEDVPPHWMTYFAVVDTDASAARAAELGGTVAVPPFDMGDVGRVAVLNDPEGAVFSIIRMATS